MKNQTSSKAGERTHYEVTYKCTRRDSGDKRDLQYDVVASNPHEAVGKANKKVEKFYDGNNFHVLLQNCVPKTPAKQDRLRKQRDELLAVVHDLLANVAWPRIPSATLKRAQEAIRSATGKAGRA